MEASNAYSISGICDEMERELSISLFPGITVSDTKHIIAVIDFHLN